MISFYNTAKGMTVKYYQSMIDVIDGDAEMTDGEKPIMFIISQYKAEHLLMALWTVKQNQTEIPQNIWPYQDEIVEWLKHSAYDIHVISSVAADISVPDIYSTMVQSVRGHDVKVVYADTEHQYPSKRNDIFINSRKETQDDIITLALHTQIETHWNVGYADIYDSSKIKVHKIYGSTAEGESASN